MLQVHQSIRQHLAIHIPLSINMEPHPASMPHPAQRRSRFAATVAAQFLAVFAFLNAMKASVESNVSAPMSRRAMLAAMKEESANANPIKDIAIGFILIGVALLVALAFWPAITSAVATAQADGNTSDSASTVIGLIPLLLAVGLLVGAVAFLFRGIKGLGSG